MKTKPMKHQEVGRARLAAAPEYFALGAEQGTGKTWMLLDDAEAQWKSGAAEALLVIAPKGVHVNWVLREIPKHLEIPHSAGFWLSGSGVRYMRRLERIFEVDHKTKIPILTMNIDAVNTPKGFEFAKGFLKKFRCIMTVDESQKIKNPIAKRTKKVILLGELAVSRRISSGTLVSNGPLDLFSQFDFLHPGLLGTTSFRAFTAEFAELLPAHHALVREIAAKSRGRVPQIVKKGDDGRPAWRNLEKLRALLAPHMYRVLKKDCLDLPDKLYQTHYFELTKKQAAYYRGIKNDLLYMREDGEVDTFTALTVIHKLRQVTSGFILVDGKATDLIESRPRLDALKYLVDNIDGPIIIWASFREEMRQIAEELKGYAVVEYHGGTSDADRDIAVDSFQAGGVKAFLGNPGAAGTGLTLTAAETVIYYSCDYDLDKRSQSEDRSHRFGTKTHVLYIDLVARDTIDERIAASLQSKAGVAAAIVNNL